MTNRNDQQFMVQKIRSQYVEKQVSALDTLRALDAKVKKPANVFGYIFGSIAAVIMGAGMSLTMTDLGATLGINHPMLIGIIVGLIGMGLAILNYPIYRRILNRRKEKYSDEILSLSETLLNN